MVLRPDHCPRDAGSAWKVVFCIAEGFGPSPSAGASSCPWNRANALLDWSSWGTLFAVLELCSPPIPPAMNQSAMLFHLQLQSFKRSILAYVGIQIFVNILALGYASFIPISFMYLSVFECIDCIILCLLYILHLLKALIMNYFNGCVFEGIRCRGG